MRKTKLCAVALLSLAPLSGCSNTIVATAENLCRDWRHQTVSKSDKITQGTAEQIESSNKSRPNWGCEPGENRAKS